MRNAEEESKRTRKECNNNLNYKKALDQNISGKINHTADHRLRVHMQAALERFIVFNIFFCNFYSKFH